MDYGRLISILIKDNDKNVFDIIYCVCKKLSIYSNNGVTRRPDTDMREYVPTLKKNIGHIIIQSLSLFMYKYNARMH